VDDEARAMYEDPWLLHRVTQNKQFGRDQS
jgi:hypothetical protein